MKILVLSILFATVGTVEQAQGAYSEAGEKPYIDRKDWRGLLGYNLAWTQAEPNNATAWYGLATRCSEFIPPCAGVESGVA